MQFSRPLRKPWKRNERCELRRSAGFLKSEPSIPCARAPRRDVRVQRSGSGFGRRKARESSSGCAGRGREAFPGLLTRRRSARPPGTLRVPRVHCFLFLAKPKAAHSDGFWLGAIAQNRYSGKPLGIRQLQYRNLSRTLILKTTGWISFPMAYAFNPWYSCFFSTRSFK